MKIKMDGKDEHKKPQHDSNKKKGTSRELQ